MYICIYVYVCIYIYIHIMKYLVTHVPERACVPAAVNKNTPFAQALALQSSGRICYPAPDLVL